MCLSGSSRPHGVAWTCSADVASPRSLQAPEAVGAAARPECAGPRQSYSVYAWPSLSSSSGGSPDAAWDCENRMPTFWGREPPPWGKKFGPGRPHSTTSVIVITACNDQRSSGSRCFGTIEDVGPVATSWRRRRWITHAAAHWTTIVSAVPSRRHHQGDEGRLPKVLTRPPQQQRERFAQLLAGLPAPFPGRQ